MGEHTFDFLRLRPAYAQAGRDHVGGGQRILELRFRQRQNLTGVFFINSLGFRKRNIHRLEVPGAAIIGWL